MGTAVDTAGVSIMVIGAFVAIARFLNRRHGDTLGAYRVCRQDLGRAILLGLEFLVAADIIRTVVVHPTLDNVIVLGLIVLIRTFLSLTLQLEVDGRWPWQHPDPPDVNQNKAPGNAGLPPRRFHEGGASASPVASAGVSGPFRMRFSSTYFDQVEKHRIRRPATKLTAIIPPMTTAHDFSALEIGGIVTCLGKIEPKELKRRQLRLSRPEKRNAGSSLMLTILSIWVKTLGRGFCRQHRNRNLIMLSSNRFT